MTKKIAIVDYDCGNIASVLNAVKFLKFSPKVTKNPEEILSADKIILPGVGSFEQGIRNLKMNALDQILKDLVFNQKIPILGICLGAQMMLEKSEESEGTIGLGWIKGQVEKLKEEQGKWRVPHVGWNKINYVNNSCFNEKQASDCFYFTHSYAMKLKESETVVATCEYSTKFDVVFAKNNIYGCQFHPEKSQKNGLNFLQKFLEMDLITK